MQQRLGRQLLVQKVQAQVPQSRGCYPGCQSSNHAGPGPTHAEKVFDRTIRVVEAGAKGTDDLIALEAHLDHTFDSLLKLGTGDWN